MTHIQELRRRIQTAWWALLGRPVLRGFAFRVLEEPERRILHFGIRGDWPIGRSLVRDCWFDADEVLYGSDSIPVREILGNHSYSPGTTPWDLGPGPWTEDQLP